MRIDPNVAIKPATAETQPKSQVPPKAPAPTESASVVALSPAATQAATSRNPPSITSRIERIRGLLERGAYPVDLDVLASRIVDDEVLRAGKPS